MAEDHIDRTQVFLDSLQQLGDQLKAAEERQKFFLTRMMNLQKQGLTDTQEYKELSGKSQSLQDLICHFRPIYQERLEMVRNAQLAVKKRTRRK